MDLRLFPLYLCATIVERFKAIKFVSFLRSLGICERPIVPSRGPLILHGNNFLDGDEIQFSCVANYDLFGSQRSRCVGQKWNNRKPECKGRLFFSQLTLWAYFSAHADYPLTAMLFLSSKEMKEGDEREGENVICCLDYVNVDTQVLTSRRILNFRVLGTVTEFPQRNKLTWS